MDYRQWFLTSWLTTCIFIGLLLPALAFRSNSTARPAVKLSDIIKEGYDSFQTPENGGLPTDVSIQIEFLNIRSVDVAEMSFIADIFLYKTWKDTRLVYPASKRVEKISLPPEWRKNLWTPDVYFYNAVKGEVIDTIIPYVYLWMKNDSTLVFGARLSLQFSCDMLLHYFPHDTQTCDIILKSLTHTLSEMNLHWNPIDSLSVGDFIILPQFEFSTPQTSKCEEQHHMGKHGKFACLRGVIKLTRRSGYYVINIYVPSILIVFMSMLTFWIPVDAVPGRVTLGVTSLLTIITKQYQASLPSVSYIVALNVWLSGCIAFVFGSLLEYAAVVAIRNHQSRIVPEARKDMPSNSSLHQSRENCSHTLYSKLETIDVLQIDRVCRVAFPIIFAGLSLSYWIFYTL